MPAVVSSERVAETGKNAKSRAQDQESAAEQWNKLRNSVDCAACGVSPRTGRRMTEEERRRVGKQLREELSTFVSAHAEEIIQAAAPGIPQKEVESMKKALNSLDSFVAGELLFAVQETKEVHALVNVGFLDRMKALDDDIASSLLFEVRATGNVAALTDERLFQEHAAGFFNSLGTEAASEWFYSIGDTGNVAALTSRQVLSENVLGVIRQDGKVSSEFSKAVGETGRIDALTSGEFLGFMKAADTNFASEYLSAVWCTGKVDELTNGSTFGSFRNGTTGLWKDVARMFEGNRKGMERVIMAKPGDQHHDRGPKLAMQALFAAGYSVMYVGDVQTHAQVLAAARREGATAIGFSMSSNLDKRIALETVKAVSVQGLSGIRIFGGGMLSQENTRELERGGISLFNGNAAMLEFLGGRRVQGNGPVPVRHENGYRVMERAVLAASNRQVQHLGAIRSMLHASGIVQAQQLSVPVPIHLVKNVQKASHPVQREPMALNGSAKAVAKIRAELVLEKHTIRGTVVKTEMKRIAAVFAMLAHAQVGLHNGAIRKEVGVLLNVGKQGHGSGTVAKAGRISAHIHGSNARVRFEVVLETHRTAAISAHARSTIAMRRDAAVTVGSRAIARRTALPNATITMKMSQARNKVSMATVRGVPKSVSVGAAMRLSAPTHRGLAFSYAVTHQRTGKASATAQVQAKTVAGKKLVMSSTQAQRTRTNAAQHTLRQQLGTIRRVEKLAISNKAGALQVNIPYHTRNAAVRSNNIAGIISSSTPNAHSRTHGTPAGNKVMTSPARSPKRSILKSMVAAVLGMLLGSEIEVEEAPRKTILYGEKDSGKGLPKDIKG